MSGEFGKIQVGFARVVSIVQRAGQQVQDWLARRGNLFKDVRSLLKLCKRVSLRAGKYLII